MVSFYVLDIFSLCHDIFDKELQSCSIGTPLNEKCKRTIEDMKDVSDSDDERRKLLMLYCGLENIWSICDYHERVYFVNHILYLIETVSTQSAGAGGYCLSEKEFDNI